MIVLARHTFAGVAPKQLAGFHWTARGLGFERLGKLVLHLRGQRTVLALGARFDPTLEQLGDPNRDGSGLSHVSSMKLSAYTGKPGACPARSVHTLRMCHAFGCTKARMPSKESVVPRP